MVSPAQKKASRKYETEKTDNLRVRVPKGKKEQIQKYAEQSGISVNELINRLIDEELSQSKGK